MRSSVLAPFGPHARRHHLAELEPFGADGDALDVVRVVVLAVDEDDFLGAAGDEQLAALNHSEVAGAQPAYFVGIWGGESLGIRFRIFEVALGDVFARNEDVADVILGQFLVVIAGDAHVV